MRARSALALFIAALVAASCQRERIVDLDGGQDTKGAGDAMVDEDGAATDAGPDAAEAGDAGIDAGEPDDAGPSVDAGPLDWPDCGAAEPTVQPGPDPGMVLVPAGAFWQGCNPAIGPPCERDEMPGRCVTLSAYEIDITLVTQSQFSAYVADGGSPGQDNCDDSPDPTADMPDGPAMCVSYEAAQGYCQAGGKQLPTEAQFEKAARGIDARLFPWGNEPATCQLAVFEGCTDGIANVGSVMAGDSPYGAADMTSDVSEMVSDWYDPDYYSYAPDVDPTGPDQSPYDANTLRGEPWLPDGVFPAGIQVGLRTSARGYDNLHVPPEGVGGLPYVGFRCAKTVAE